MPVRTFVALVPAADDAGALADWTRARLDGAPGVRPVPAANLHLTLVFCGDVPEGRLAEVVGIVRDHGAEGPLRLHPAGPLAAFGSALVLPVDAGARAAALRASRAALAAALVGAGLAREERRPFRPHVTVGRVRGGAPAPAADGADAPPLACTALAALASRPGRSGVRYEPLVEVPLATT